MTTTSSAPELTSPVRRLIWPALVALGWVAAVAVHVVRPSDLWVAVAFIGVLSAAALTAWVASTRTTASRRLPSRLVAAGLTTNFLGEVVWYTVVDGSESTDVSFADFFWLISYGFLAAALWISLVRSREGERFDVDSMIDALTIVVVSVLTLWNFSVAAIAGDPSLTPLIKLVWSTYPIADAILIALVLRVVTDSRARATIDPWFGVGVAAWLVADLGFLTLPLSDLNENWENAGWMLGAILMARFHRGGRSRTPVEKQEAGWLPRLAIGIGPLAVVVLLPAVDLTLGRPLRPWGLIIGAAILLGLAVVRTARLLMSEQRAIEELSRARDAALQASRAKSEFLATMSHEIRTPMNGVLGLSDLMLRTDLDARQQQYAEGVRDAGQNLLHLINEILDFSKIEAGRLDLERVDTDLVAIVEGVADLVATAAHRQGLELLTVCDPELPALVSGDPGRLRQVLLNLASNAVKFTDSGEVVLRATTVSRTEDTVWVRFESSDTGIGVDTDPALLFEEFAQADSSTTRVYGGTGLGLAISRRLVTLMGGEIGVDSIPGAGSTFWFTVPFATPTPASPRPAQSDLAGLRVLVVDDSSAARQMLGDLLRQRGAMADLSDGTPATLPDPVDPADPSPAYDVVVVDSSMPTEAGERVSRLLAAGERRPGVVLLRSGAAPGAPEPPVAADVEVDKPVRGAALVAAVGQAAALGRERPPVVSRARVLVVDERPVSQMITGGMAEHLGFDVEVAADEVEALGALARGGFAAVLLDCPAAEARSCPAADAIRQQEGGAARTPLVAILPSDAGADEEWRRGVGVDAHLTRPVSLQELSAALESCLHLAIADRQLT